MKNNAFVAVLLISEFLFSISVELLKINSGYLFGHELWLNFTDPAEFTSAYLYLAIAGLMAFLVAFLSDNYLGKYYPSLFGLGFAFFSCLFTLRSGSNIPSRVFLLLYMCTSPMRSLLVLEQTDKVRWCLFSMIYSRVVGRGLCLVSLNYMSEYMNLALYFTLAVTLSYIVIFTCVGHEFYIEPIYINITWYVKKCFVYAFRNRRVTERGVSRYDLKLMMRKSLTEATAVEPIADVRFRSYKAITCGEAPDNSPASIEPKDDDVTPEKESWWKSLPFLIWTKRRSERGMTHRIDAPESSRASTEFSESQFEKSSLSIHLTSGDETNRVYVFSKDELIHWLIQAHPKSSYYIIMQSMRFQALLVPIFMGCMYTMLAMFISILSVHQEYISLKNEEAGMLTAGSNLMVTSFVFDLILFPIVELLFSQAVRDYFKSNLAPFALGHLLLLIAGLMFMVFQIILVKTLPFIPESHSTQVGFYNSLRTKVSIYSSVTNYKEIRALNYVFLGDIHTMGSTTMHITFRDSLLSVDSQITIEPTIMSSYIITRTGLIKNNGRAPTILSDTLYYLAKLYLVIETPNDQVTVTLEDLEDDDKVIRYYMKQNDVVNVEPSKYNIVLQINSKLSNSFSMYELRKGCLYAIFVHSGVTTLTGTIHHTEGPRFIFFEYLLSYTFLKCFANAFATVSFFKYLFLNSPEKLRSSNFGLVYSIGLSSLSFMSSQLFINATHGVHTTFMILFLCSHVIVFIIASFTIYRFDRTNES